MQCDDIDAYAAEPGVRTAAIAPYQNHGDVLDRPQERHFASAAFIYLLIGATFLFYVFAPLANPYSRNEAPSATWNYFLYSASMHVALTGIFYLDPAMFALMRQNRMRFMTVAPLAFLAVLGLWIFADERAQIYFMLPYVLWTYWHFQKQHWGVYSFVRIHEKSKPQAIDRTIALYGGFVPA
jgi:hypothetical protein